MYRQNTHKKSQRYRKEAGQALDGVTVSPTQSDLPHGYPARPTSDAVCGFVGDLGPFYTKTVLEPRADSGLEYGDFRVVPLKSGSYQGPFGLRRSGYGEANSDAGQGFLGWDTYSRDSSARHVHFENVDKNGEVVGVVMSWYSFPSDPPRPIKESAWIRVSLGAMFASTMLLMVSFVTSSWGIMIVPVTPEESAWMANDLDPNAEPLLERRWNFGLWQCCRDDGLCLGTKWPAFYTATRTFAVLSLFAHALTFAWMLGHTVEKLLNYDPCTMTTLISNCFVTSSFSLISVACFGAMWPTEFSRMYPSTSTTLGYSYFLALVTIPLTVLAGICALIDFKGTWKADEIREQFGTDEVEEEVDEEEEEDLGESIDEGESRNKSTSV